MPEVLSIPSFINRENYLKIIPLFLTELDECMTHIRIAEKNNDRSRIREVAHKLKGSSSTYGAKALHAQAVIVEKKITKGELNHIENEIIFLKSRISEFIHVVEQL